MKKKFALLATSVLALSLTLTACGTSDNGTKTGDTTASKNLLDQVKSAGVLKIGTEGTYAPYTFHAQDGSLTGFDIEVANEVAKRIGVKAQYVETQWDGMFAGLDAKRFDMIANEVGIRPDRQEKYDFSDPYIVSKAVLVTSKDNTDIKSFADLKGKKAAQSLTSNLTDIAKQNGAEIVGVEGFNQAIDMLVSKRVEATVNDGLSYLDLMKQKPDLPLKKVDEQADGAKNGMMFRKDSKELVDAVNKALTDIKSDGTYLKISQKYFGADVSK
ncbi:amino acid ABC transporter substrate-binding protein [Tumebacillus sp. ITR2]|uniref:Amino acid ABC transporter substrate-binding protein n=1 Tax=Tumebacillus amylolyticus TaxID=2801339 RepID=A0ABS1J714_9BACL|nr:amino acid ABC transporter substrate-binding protein [Tumebacillus amylolyticus]MBL0386057.1 amino acid ABC transporter substrate-binding protein [Tumebacillus amylolyticus]